MNPFRRRDKIKVIGGLLTLLLLFIGSQARSLKRLYYPTLSLDSISNLKRDSSKDTLQQADTTNKDRIFIEKVNLWTFDKSIHPDAQILRGDVVFRHKNAYMYCDSALLYEKKNRLEAFGEVRIKQGDSLNLFCHYLDYDGTTMLARLRKLVKMEHRGNTLYTDSLDYDRVKGIGYYFDNGSIVDSLNILSSVYGQYETSTKTATFNDDVVLKNNNFTLYSDTLYYDTNTHIATINSPTKIVGDSGLINATRGFYDTKNDIANLLDRAELSSGTHWATGDSLFYDRKQKLAKLYHNVILRDTAQKLDLRGNYMEYHEDTEYGYATDSSYVFEYSSKDSLWASAKELEMIKVDTVNTIVLGKGNVRLFRKDIQAVADTLRYIKSDSLIHFIGHPFLWSGASQITGDSLTIYFVDSALHHAHIRPNAYLSSAVQKDYYNQLMGREVFAYFSNNTMDSLWTKGNAETIYYTSNKDSIITEQVRSQSSAILMEFEEEEISRIVLLDKTIGKMTPLFLLTPDMLAYPTFVWFPEGRPISKDDIFRLTPLPGSGMSKVLKKATQEREGLFVRHKDPQEGNKKGKKDAIPPKKRSEQKP